MTHEVSAARKIVTSNGYVLTPADVDPAVATCAVYAIVHRHTGRVYIGVTTKTAAQRWAEHLKPSSRCRKLRFAISKHGAAAFEWVVLEHGLAESDLAVAEARWVAACGSDSDGGFNLTPGGYASPMASLEAREKKRITDALPEVRARRSQALRQAFATSEHLAKRAAAQLARYNDPAERLKSSEAQQLRFRDPSERMKISAGRRRGSPKYSWRHIDGRQFMGGQTALVEAFPEDRLIRSKLACVAGGHRPHHKGWRLAA